MRVIPLFSTYNVQQEQTQDEIIIDGGRLSRSLRRSLRLWAWLGPLLAGALLLLLLVLVPRSYTATTSVAIQQSSSGGGGALAALTGGSSSSKRYLGLLKSRDLAAKVERHVHLRTLYDLPTEEKAITLLTKSIKPDDNAVDGLLYIDVTLAGPPGLGVAHHGPSADQVKSVVAEAANDYALALKDYYATSDTDQGAALLRGANTQVKTARADYDRSLGKVIDFTRGLNGIDPRSIPSSSDPSALPSGSLSGLGTLYGSLAAVQAELQSAQAARSTRDALTTEQLQEINNLPTDDPLLSEARNRVAQDKTALSVAEKLYGPENPAVVRARKQLEVDNVQLQQQIQGVRQRLTTPNVRSDEQIQSLYARQAVLTRQVRQAEQRLGLSRQLSSQFGKLQTEVTLRLEVLRTTLAEAAKIRLNNAAGGSKMSVIDPAEPPLGGNPGPLKLGAVAVTLTLLAFLISVARDYLRQSPTPGLPRL